MTPDQIRKAEQSFAYEYAGGKIEGFCLYAGSQGGNTWVDLSKAEGDVSREIAYLDSRGLLQRHPVNPSIVTVLPEDEPQSAAEGLVQ